MKVFADVFQRGEAVLSTVKSIGYYQARYVQRGESGLFRDSMGCTMIHHDALAAQRELARRLTSAVSSDRASDSRAAALTPNSI